MNTARLTAARTRNANGSIRLRRTTTPLRRWARAWLGALGRSRFGADPRQQLWSWFLPNPGVHDTPPVQTLNRPDGAESPRRANILLVGHDHQTQERLRLWLQLDGHLVAEAADGAGALQVIAQEPPDIVLLDLSRSEVSWMEFIVGLSRLRPRPPVRVIGLAPSTTGAGGCDRIRFFATDVLQQPVRQEELRSAVAAALGDARAVASGATA